MRFPIALHTDDEIRYGVIVPDLPGCFSAGDTLDEAIEMARQAVDAHVELLLESGESLPTKQAIAQHQANPELSSAAWAVIDVPVERYLGTAEKTNITVPALVLSRIDEYAKRHGESRSGFLTRATLDAMRTAG